MRGEKDRTGLIEFGFLKDKGLEKTIKTLVFEFGFINFNWGGEAEDTDYFDCAFMVCLYLIQLKLTRNQFNLDGGAFSLGFIFSLKCIFGLGFGNIITQTNKL